MLGLRIDRGNNYIISLSHHPCYKEAAGVILPDVLMQSKPLEKILKTKTEALKALIPPSEDNFCPRNCS